ncbi:MAG: hypothetical protein Q7R90_03875 [bacterium]|nr:hypothetical protein [bacterium]
MEDTELREAITRIERKLDATFASAEKTRKYFLGVIVVSVVAFILPLLGLIFAIPSLLSGYAGLGSI